MVLPLGVPPAAAPLLQPPPPPPAAVEEVELPLPIKYEEIQREAMSAFFWLPAAVRSRTLLPVRAWVAATSWRATRGWASQCGSGLCSASLA